MYKRYINSIIIIIIIIIHASYSLPKWQAVKVKKTDFLCTLSQQ